MADVVDVRTRRPANQTIGWDADQASAERYLRQTPYTDAMSDEEIARAAADAVERCRRGKESAHETRVER